MKVYSHPSGFDTKIVQGLTGVRLAIVSDKLLNNTFFGWCDNLLYLFDVLIADRVNSKIYYDFHSLGENFTEKNESVL